MKSRNRNKADIPRYIDTYLRTICSVKGIPQSISPILYHMMVYISSIDKHLYLNSALKEQIANKCGVKIYSVNKAITHLVKKNIIERINFGTYQINYKDIGINEIDFVGDIVVTINFKTGEVNNG